jgi:hypothetical protein
VNVTVAGIAAGLVVLVLTVELLRRRALREKYAALWLVVSLAAVVFAVFPQFLGWLARVLGFQVPANLLFAIVALVLLVVSMQFSLEVGRQESRSQRLAEEVALLRHSLERLDGRADPQGLTDADDATE